MIDDLKPNSMMAYLLESLAAGKDIGHYGRLVFLMVARHFADADELETLLAQDKDFSPEQARELIVQVAQADYSPPKRDKVLDFQSRQDFQFVPNPEDPDSGNVYKDLRFPEHVYEHIGQYREAKAHAEA